VAVEMHGVSSGGGIVNNDTDRGVAAEVLDVPFCGVGKVALVGEQEQGCCSWRGKKSRLRSKGNCLCR
jgi:hypothetical protein